MFSLPSLFLPSLFLPSLPLHSVQKACFAPNLQRIALFASLIYIQYTSTCKGILGNFVLSAQKLPCIHNINLHCNANEKKQISHEKRNWLMFSLWSYNFHWLIVISYWLMQSTMDCPLPVDTCTDHKWLWRAFRPLFHLSTQLASL